MGWVSLSLRKASLQAAISEYTLRDIQISRTLRAVHREMTTEQAIIQRNKTNELSVAKKPYTELLESRPETNSAEYEEWYVSYQKAQMEYEEQKLNINNEFDYQLSQLEEETSDREADLQQEQTLIETQLEALRAEIEAVEEQISTDIKNSTIKI